MIAEQIFAYLVVGLATEGTAGEPQALEKAAELALDAGAVFEKVRYTRRRENKPVPESPLDDVADRLKSIDDTLDRIRMEMPDA